MKKTLSKGFTLIELLVVIAIIGILAGVVLTSLGTARDKAKDARIISELAQMRTYAEMLADGGSYAALCDGLGDINIAHATYGTELSSLKSDMTTSQGGTNLACHADASNYCVSIETNISGTKCVSSTGNSGDDICTAANTVCAN